jgi:hypothetical protein
MSRGDGDGALAPAIKTENGERQKRRRTQRLLAPTEDIGLTVGTGPSRPACRKHFLPSRGDSMEEKIELLRRAGWRRKRASGARSRQVGCLLPGARRRGDAVPARTCRIYRPASALSILISAGSNKFGNKARDSSIGYRQFRLAMSCRAVLSECGNRPPLGVRSHFAKIPIYKVGQVLSSRRLFSYCGFCAKKQLPITPFLSAWPVQARYRKPHAVSWLSPPRSWNSVSASA